MLSVVICTHNSRPPYFSKCLEALHSQTLPLSSWELVIVDNRSDTPLADRIDLAWHPSARMIREETLGLTPARLRGIRESKGDLLVFVDGDNVLDPDFRRAARRTFEKSPFLGSGGCHGRPGFERPPPEWARRY